MRKRWASLGWFTLFCAPILFVFMTVVIIPFVMGIVYSFYSWDGIPLNPKVFVGLRNYTTLFSDTRFLTSAATTFRYAILAVIIVNIVGFSFALLVTNKTKMSNPARTMLFMPNLIGGLILGFIWQFVFEVIFKAVGQGTGLNMIFFNWLIEPHAALYAIILVSTWQMAGYYMIIYIAGIKNIPADVIEASTVDGASYLQRIRYLVLPLMMPSFTICVFLSLSNSFKIYDVNLSLTRGGPYSSTEMFAMNIFNEIFASRNFGYGQAKAVCFFIIIAIITLSQVYFSKKSEVEA